MDKLKMIKAVADGNYTEFRKGYLAAMNEEFKTNKDILKTYVYKKISMGKPTGI